ncbi:MAG: hypothetical protein EOP00_02850 [Pedobacter sp.]|nr:MAG: hypothetical protein EOP00_02850 [Pedobacter sp.]
MVSKVLRTLQEKGFVSRKEHETDTRAKTIKLTNAGEVILQKAIIAIENADIDFFASLATQISSFNQNMVQLVEVNKGE